MADGKAGTSGSRYMTRNRTKRKPAEIVEISDSSSESSDDKEPPLVKLAPIAETSPECPVCLQPCIHPARLPCGHIFCFLCLKGIAQQSRRCAMCRKDISPDYLEQPDLLEVPNPQSEKESETFEDGYQWFYEGRNGWWQYDERTSRELEASYKSGNQTCELLIAGFLYTADFDLMVQTRRNEPHRRRRMKRDLSTIAIKGVAGIRYIVNSDSITEQLSSLTLSGSANEEG